MASEHMTRALAEKRLARLVQMSRPRKGAAPLANKSMGEIREENPRMQNMFVLLATRGKTVMKYVGGVRFATKGRAVLFPSRVDAERVARDLRSRFPVLKGYTLRVQS